MLIFFAYLDFFYKTLPLIPVIESFIILAHRIRISDILLWDRKSYLIPLFHTGHESRESPRIDFLLIQEDL